MQTNNAVAILENIGQALKVNTFITSALNSIVTHPQFPNDVTIKTRKEGKFTYIVITDSEGPIEIFGNSGHELQAAIKCTIAVMLGKPVDENNRWFIDKYFNDKS